MTATHAEITHPHNKMAAPLVIMIHTLDKMTKPLGKMAQPLSKMTKPLDKLTHPLDKMTQTQAAIIHDCGLEKAKKTKTFIFYNQIFMNYE
jgi:uncharacterized protein YoxC